MQELTVQWYLVSWKQERRSPPQSVQEPGHNETKGYAHTTQVDRQPTQSFVRPILSTVMTVREELGPC